VVEALEQKSQISPDRWQASLKYMEVLARMHRIDPAKFVAAGCEMPQGDAQAAMNGYERFYRMYQRKGLDDAFLEFCTGWLRRNVPKHRPLVSFVTGDCGQFLSDGPQLTAIIDMEIGHLADHFARRRSPGRDRLLQERDREPALPAPGSVSRADEPVAGHHAENRGNTPQLGRHRGLAVARGRVLP